MRGNFLFIVVMAFALGVLCRTLLPVPVVPLGVSVIFGLFALGLWVFDNKVLYAVFGILLISFSLGVIRTSFVQDKLPAAYVPMLEKPISLTGTIVADPDIRQKDQQLIVQTSTGGQKTSMLVFAPLFQHFSYGEKILLDGILKSPMPFDTGDGRVFRYDHYLAKKGIFSLIPRAGILAVASPKGMWNTIANTLFSLKHAFVEGLSRALPDPYAQLATGLLTGDQHGLSDSLKNELDLSGLIWIVVLAGYHITLIAEAALVLCAFLPSKFRYMFAILSIALVIFATGASAPSLRGGIMAALMLFARSTGRTYDALRALAAALLLILLWNPYLLAYDSGFQLSLVITPALLLGTPIFERRILWIKSAFIREVVSVSVIAQLACTPLILWQTGVVGVWSIPANMLVMPLVPLAMLAAVVAGFVGVLVPPLAPAISLPAYVLLRYLELVAQASASLPLSGTTLPAFSFMWVLGMYATLIALIWWLKNDAETTPPRLEISSL